MKIGAANSYYLIRTCSESIEALEPGGIDQRASMVQEHALQCKGQCISLAYRPAIPALSGNLQFLQQQARS